MRKRAFTLVELLVVVVIIGILATLAEAKWQGYRDRADMLVDETNQKTILLGMELFADDNGGELPESVGELYPRYVKSVKTLTCASDKTPPTVGYDGKVNGRSYTINPYFRGKRYGRDLVSKNPDIYLLVESEDNTSTDHLAYRHGGTFLWGKSKDKDTAVVTYASGKHERCKQQ